MTTANPKGLGPRMLALHPRHRIVVSAYLDTGVKFHAGKNAGYKGKSVYQVLDREDVSLAIVEETRRRLMLDLPQHVQWIKDLASGEAGRDEQPVPMGVRLRAAEFLTSRGGLHEIQELHAVVDVNVTIIDKWKKLVALYKSQGKDTTLLLENLPENERLLITQGTEEDISDVEFVNIGDDGVEY